MQMIKKVKECNLHIGVKTVVVRVAVVLGGDCPRWQLSGWHLS